MEGYAAVVALAAAVTYVATWVVRGLAVRLGAVVLPDERRVHDRPTPTAGGVAMFLGFLAAMVLASRLPQFRPLFEGSSKPLGVILAATVMFGVGLLDDLREVSAPAKLSGQVLSASVLSLFGVTMLYFQVPFGGFVVLSPDLAPLVTVLWVAVIANSVNIIDGLDGLAAGIVAIGSAAFFVYSDRLFDAGLIGPENVGPLLAAIAVGVCLGFLPHNARIFGEHHRARIFMGDAGALLLGLLMAASTVVVGGGTADQFSGQTFFFFAPVFIPFVILGVPILDTLFAIVRRAARRKNLSAADKEHLHHRLMRLGHGHRRAVVILWAWTAILSAVVLFPTVTGLGNAVIPTGVAALGVLLYTLFHPGVREVRAGGGEVPDELDEPAPGVAEGSVGDCVHPAVPEPFDSASPDAVPLALDDLAGPSTADATSLDAIELGTVAGAPRDAEAAPEA